MPTIDVSYKDLCKLMGRKPKDLDEDVMYAKGEVDKKKGDSLKIDVKDTNRPDLWSAEGIAREIRCRHRGGMPSYKTKKPKIKVLVDKSVSPVRPHTTCAVVRSVKFDKNSLDQIIQLQEKVSQTFGRNRKEVAIGVYDLDKIKPPIKYTTVKPGGIKFVPLDSKEEMTPAEILGNHPKGREFGHLLEGKKKYPMFIDSQGNVLSIPPIINSDRTGKVSSKTRNVFIECSGFDPGFLKTALNVMVCALADRGGKIESVEIRGRKKLVTPDLGPKDFSIDPAYVNSIFGSDLKKKDITDLLSKSGYEAKSSGKAISVKYPAYRQDIMHPRDVVEDVIISYGYNNVEPATDPIPTKGGVDDMTMFRDDASEIMIGLGLQEILSYSLTDKSNLFSKMEASGKSAEIDNPVSKNWSVLRTRLLPCVLDFFSGNMHVEYPQKVFEVGTCVIPDKRTETSARDVVKLCAALTGPVSYDDLAPLLDAFLSMSGIDYALEPAEDSGFIDGRCASVEINGKSAGIIGEIHPQVLNNWGLERPVAAFELNMNRLLDAKD